MDAPRGPGDQRIARLTPLAEALATIAAVVRPVEPEPGGGGTYGVLAQDLRAIEASPPLPVAFLDGYAVSADDTTGASVYVPLPQPGPPAWCEAGMELPQGRDAILPPEAGTLEGGVLHATETVGAGHGVRTTGEDFRAGDLLHPSGTRLTAYNMLHVPETHPLRLVRPAVVANPFAGDAVTWHWIGTYLMALGALYGAPTFVPLAEALDAAPDTQLIVTIGGTGPGGADRAIDDIAALGTVLLHGVAIDPGATAGIGTVRGRTIVALPGRPEATIAAALMLLPAVLRAMTLSLPEPVPAFRGRLTRKVAGGAGRTRIVFARADGGTITPLGGAGVPLKLLDAANAYLVVPAGSEGLQDGDDVAATPLPRYLVGV